MAAKKKKAKKKSK